MKAPLNVVVCAPIMGADLDPVRRVDPSINLVDGNELFAAWSRARGANDTAGMDAAERKMRAMLGGADVVCMMYPVPQHLMPLAPHMCWLHHTQAGVSNLWGSDVWQAGDLLITSGRGHVRPTAMAEQVFGSALLFARGLHDGYLDKQAGSLDRGHYDLIRVAGATMGVIGLGGIGREVARLSKALGMRVVATRRSVTSVEENVDNTDLLLPPSELSRLAAESDFIAICIQLTRETTHMLDAAFFAAVTKRRRTRR